VVSSCQLASLYDFENRDAVFPGVHRSYKFSLVTLSGTARPVEATDFVFFAHRADQLREADRHIALAPRISGS